MLFIDLIIAASLLASILVSATTQRVITGTVPLVLLLVFGYLAALFLEDIGLSFTALVTLLGVALNMGMAMHLNYRRT